MRYNHGRASLILALSTLLGAVRANFALGGFGENFRLKAVDV